MNNSCIGGVHWWDKYHLPIFSSVDFLIMYNVATRWDYIQYNQNQNYKGQTGQSNNIKIKKNDKNSPYKYI